MDPILVLIAISAVVMVFPSIKNALANLNKTDTEPAAPVIFPGTTAAGSVPSPNAGCVDNLVRLAKCLPEDQGDALIKQYAAELVLREIRKK